MRTTINDFESQQELYVDTTACVTRVSVLIHRNILYKELKTDPSQLEQQQQCS